MIPRSLIDAINEIRNDAISIVEILSESKSFQALASTTPPVQRALEGLVETLVQGPLKEPCEGRITCAIVGSSGHGKTTIVDEMFPSLSQRGWLVTDVTDTTSQSLRIEHAPENSEALESVRVRSWNIQSIKDLMAHPEVEEANRVDQIKVQYRDRHIEVDGSESPKTEGESEPNRFPDKLELHPFSAPYQVPKEKRHDKAFIRALTIKEQSQGLDAGSVMKVGKHSYNSLQLRALVKDVTLHDSFQQLRKWVPNDVDQDSLAKLTFVDTPGLAVNGSAKDEILRHFLEKKSHQLITKLWREDELDVVVHLVLNGRQSDFAQLWKSVEREMGPGAMESLAERLILAINGTNIYFTNRDLKKRFDDPEVAEREGDHLATTLEDNILQKMSPHGRVRPARLCFVDSKNIVDTLTGDYAKAYDRYRPQMKSWCEPGGVGHETLSDLGILDSFSQNIEALADPEDRGQGFLLRELLSLVKEKGAEIAVKKYLVRTGILRKTEALLSTVLKYYTPEGELNRHGVQEALKGCLAFLDRRDLRTIETFAQEAIDPHLDQLVPSESDEAGPEWVEDAFQALCQTVKTAVLEKSEAPVATANQFAQYFDDMTHRFADSWGYGQADFPPPHQGYTGSSDLIRHSLGVHGREIVYQLLIDDTDTESSRQYEQDRADRDRIKNAVTLLDNARRTGVSLCADARIEA